MFSIQPERQTPRGKRTFQEVEQEEEEEAETHLSKRRRVQSGEATGRKVLFPREVPGPQQHAAGASPLIQVILELSRCKINMLLKCSSSLALYPGLGTRLALVFVAYSLLTLVF